MELMSACSGGATTLGGGSSSSASSWSVPSSPSSADEVPPVPLAPPSPSPAPPPSIMSAAARLLPAPRKEEMRSMSSNPPLPAPLRTAPPPAPLLARSPSVPCRSGSDARRVHVTDSPTTYTLKSVPPWLTNCCRMHGGRKPATSPRTMLLSPVSSYTTATEWELALPSAMSALARSGSRIFFARMAATTASGSPSTTSCSGARTRRSSGEWAPPSHMLLLRPEVPVSPPNRSP
mmetsp:Transcript_30912/g.100632  ORF Transcript_30912/g.100632 Transcript_30912/m.100632 type:complete len:234 (-) Transcript_30912:362-1063(-)